MKKTTTAFVLCFLLLSSPAIYAQSWLARHAMDPSAFQTVFNSMLSKNLRPTSISGYTSDGKEMYAAIWKPNTGPAWMVKHAMTSGQFDTAFKEASKAGYRPTCISGFVVNNQLKFAAIWEKSKKPKWAAKYNLTSDQYQEAFDEYNKKGYRLQYVSAYVMNGTAYFAAIWDKSTGGALIAKHNLTKEQLVQNNTTIVSNGYKLKILSGYEKDGTDYYAAIWEKMYGPVLRVLIGVPGDIYQSDFNKLLQEGYMPVSVNVFDSYGYEKFNTIWQYTGTQ